MAPHRRPPGSSAETNTWTGSCPIRSSAADVAQAGVEADDMDRAYAMNLAMIRKAAQLTQVEVAKRLGVGQAAVSRMESRGDMLLSTLYDYLTATGADTASIVVTVHGRRIELDLGSLRGRPETATH